MPPSKPPSLTKFLSVCCLLNILAVLAIWQPIYYSNDLAETIYHAREILIGRVPYRDFYCHHFVGYLLPFVLAELTIGTDPWQIAVVQIIFQCTYTLVLALVVLKISKSNSCACWAGLLSATAGWFPLFQGMFFNYQSYTLPFLAVFLYLILCAIQESSSRSVNLAALFFGLLITFDQRILAFSPLLVIPALTTGSLRRPAKILTTIGFGLIIPGLCLIGLYRLGAFSEFFDQTIIFPILYRNSSFEHVSIWYRWLELLRFWSQEPAAVFGTIASIALFVTVRDRGLKLFYLFALLGALVYLLSGGRRFSNYLLLLSPILIISLALVPHYFSAYRYLPRCLPVFLFLLSLESIVVFPLVADRFRQIYSYSGHIKLAQNLGRLSTIQDRILVWSYCPQIYLYSKRFSEFRDMGLITFAGSLFHLAPVSTANVVPKMLSEFKEYLSRTPPRFVVARLPSGSEKTYTNGGACLVGNQKRETELGLLFFREFLDSRYDLIGSEQDGEITLGLFRQKEPSS